MFLFILPLHLTGSSYFTYGSLASKVQSYSFATYWSLDYRRNYIMCGYDNYLEDCGTVNLRQHLLSVGYAREIVKAVGIRAVGFYIFDSASNSSKILSNRLLYGYSPIFSLGYVVASYSKQLLGSSIFYTFHQFNPDVRIQLFNKVWLLTGLCYGNAEGEGYLSLLTGVSVQVLPYLGLEFKDMSGERFYSVDDRLLTVNNRPNIENSNLSVQLNYRVIDKFKFSLSWIFNSFSSYSINYYVIGVEGMM